MKTKCVKKSLIDIARDKNMGGYITHIHIKGDH